MQFLYMKNCIFNYSSYLCRALVRDLYSKESIKRESGENPEQSRCCEFHTNVVSIYQLATESNKFGKALINGNKSEDLPC